MLVSVTIIALAAIAIAAPIKGIDRQHVEDEYDFIIAGGECF